MREILFWGILLAASALSRELQRSSWDCMQYFSQQREQSYARSLAKREKALSGLLLTNMPSLRPISNHAVVSHDMGRQRGSRPNMGGGILQKQPGIFNPDGIVPMIEQLNLQSRPHLLPKLIVFDLDNTLWTPELYTLRNLRGAPKAGKDVWLLDGASAVLWELGTADEWQGTKVAVASRTNKVEWAQKLLTEFDIPGAEGRKLSDMLAQIEIYPKDKAAHFRQLCLDLQIEYKDMLFFDDSYDGKYGNCVPVSKLGVLTAHCPDGLTEEVWRLALSSFAELTEAGKPKDRVLKVQYPSDSAKVVRVVAEKGFGFVQLENNKGKRNSDIFFHRSVVPHGFNFDDLLGARVEVEVSSDESGRSKVMKMDILDEIVGSSRAAHANSDDSTITLPCFSMGMPFAALLAHGYKTEESRNHGMFEGTYGETVLLHVGYKTFEDDGKHIKILQANGLKNAMIKRLTDLAPGFSRGDAVAVMKLGDTRLLSVQERSSPKMQKAICAYGRDSGKYVTEIQQVAWLEEPVKIRGQGGIFSATIPKAALPNGFLAEEEEKSGFNTEKNEAGDDTIWKVVGGSDKGGILVRVQQDLSSPQEPTRLSTGAHVLELELAGDRLHYKLLAGTGPKSGWVSLKLKSNDLLVRAEKFEAGDAVREFEKGKESVEDEEGDIEFEFEMGL